MSTEISVAVRRAVIETNLERCRDRAAQNLVEIGRWLNAAKEEGVVPHGQWTAWEKGRPSASAAAAAAAAVP